MSVRGTPAPAVYAPEHYWEDRARRFASERDGLAAVCSYGMPEFYNRAIQHEQQLALLPWVRVHPGARVLDLGCGVGRWSRRLAAQGAHVTGVDLSPTMIAQARCRAAAEKFPGRCEFQLGDIANLEVCGPYDLIVGVTVLQHILDPERLQQAVARCSTLLAERGRLVLLEAAPTASVDRCDTSIFKARQRTAYLQLFRQCGLELVAMTGVDPAPFRRRILPYLRNIPRSCALGLIALTTALSLPVNALFGRRATAQSWHVVFVLERCRHAG